MTSLPTVSAFRPFRDERVDGRPPFLSFCNTIFKYITKSEKKRVTFNSVMDVSCCLYRMKATFVFLHTSLQSSGHYESLWLSCCLWHQCPMCIWDHMVWIHFWTLILLLSASLYAYRRPCLTWKELIRLLDLDTFTCVSFLMSFRTRLFHFGSGSLL